MSRLPTVERLPVKFAALEMVCPLISPEVMVPTMILPEASLLTARLTVFAVVASACTKAVVASCVVLVPTNAVGASGVPVSVGDADRTTVLPVPVIAFTVLLLIWRMFPVPAVLNVLFVRVRVFEAVAISTPSIDTLPAAVRASVVSVG